VQADPAETVLPVGMVVEIVVAVADVPEAGDGVAVAADVLAAVAVDGMAVADTAAVAEDGTSTFFATDPRGFRRIDPRTEIEKGTA
jgi:hypothetical protein